MLPEGVEAYIGLETDPEVACDAVEPGAVRRFAQAIMDENIMFSVPSAENARFGGPVAPPLYPAHIFRRPFGAPDPVQERAFDPDFDGMGVNATQGLPEILPLQHLGTLNGGSEFEFYRYARHGERITVRSRYAEIYERQTSKGALILVVVESEYRNGEGDLLLRLRRTQVRR